MPTKPIISVIVSILLSLSLTSCSTFKPDDIVPIPSNLTVSEALADIGAGFSRMKKELDENKLGVFPCKITVDFNVTAGAGDSGELVLNLSSATSSSTANLESKSNSNAQRGNTVRIEMYNPGCLPKDTLGSMNPEKVKDAMSGMIIPANGINILGCETNCAESQ